MDPNRKITNQFTNKFGSKVINRQYFHRKTGLKRERKKFLAVSWHGNNPRQTPTAVPIFFLHGKQDAHCIPEIT